MEQLKQLGNQLKTHGNEMKRNRQFDLLNIDEVQGMLGLKSHFR